MDGLGGRTARQPPGETCGVLRLDVLPGLEIISYRRAVNRGLVEEEPLHPENPPPDYVGMGALVLAREMTWGPCIVPPERPKDIHSLYRPLR